MRFICSLVLVWGTLCSAQRGYQVILQPSIGYVYQPQVAHVDPGYFYPDSVYGPPTDYEPDDGFPQMAECLLVAANTSSVSGELRLTQSGLGGPLLITGTVYGLTPGKHGFHMHREPNLDDNCKAAGPHFNPANKTHGSPSDDNRHAGDFGNIVADSSGVADVSVLADLVSLEPGAAGFAVGRALVVHAGEDDLGKGGNEESLKTGNAGGRLACCVVKQRHFGSN